MNGNHQEIELRLAPFAYLRRVFDHCLAQFILSNDIILSAKGSLAAGQLDEFSDLDFLIIVHNPAQVASVNDWARQTVHGAGKPIASFPATHIGLDNLLVSFLEVDGNIVKVDVEVVPLSEPYPDYLGTVLHDPTHKAEQFMHKGLLAPTRPDFNDIGQKFCGWIWYTYTKIARGELLEAVDALGGMRRLALLPVLQFVLELPYEGHRRLEERLPAETLKQLHSTYPARIERQEIYHSLNTLIDIFRDSEAKLAARLDNSYRRPDLDSMIRLMQESESRLTES